MTKIPRNDKLELAILVGGRRIYAHAESICVGQFCAIHRTSLHRMANFPQLWREDRALMERICPHGVGHPDPDHMKWYASCHTAEEVWAEGVHGCDGCCR